MKETKQYSTEVRERAVRLVLEHEREYQESEHAVPQSKSTTVAWSTRKDLEKSPHGDGSRQDDGRWFQH